jgi:hypothetical protein
MPKILRHCINPQKEKATLISECGLYLMPATTYSPTHFRVQYNRPCGAIVAIIKATVASPIFPSRRCLVWACRERKS